MVECKVKCVGVIVVFLDWGLCGGLNINLFKKIIVFFKEWIVKGCEVDMVLIGGKVVSFFCFVGGNVVVIWIGLGD